MSGLDWLEDRIATEGLGEGETLESLRVELDRAVVSAALAFYGKHVRAAEALGLTREGLYKVRKRVGVESGGNHAKPIPEDWRDRLPSRPSSPGSRT
ncbi:MAG: hypothetical protein ACYTKD_31985 [Planctomycetota bacterium]|jgi:DNA-binding NtrC family response regulator